MTTGREWKRGHASRGVGRYQRAADPLSVLPSPGDDAGPDGDDVDLGDIDPDDLPELTAPAAPVTETFYPPPEITADPPPAPVGRTGRAPRGKSGAKVSQAIRNDITAKWGMLLDVIGAVWQARDPLCGGAFVQQTPPIRTASVDLIMLSPDLVEWFTGAGGNFMLLLNLLVACQPVAVTLWAHHVAHSVELPEGQAAPGARQYAA